MANMVRCHINGIPVEVPAGTTILKAAQRAGVRIPTLCYHPDLPPWAACGLCVVKVEGSPKMLRACATPVAEGARITTHDPEIVAVRRTVLSLILSTHPNDCLQCGRNGHCELQTLAADFGIRELTLPRRVQAIEKDASTKTIVLNPEKCVKCGRCAIVCQQMQNVWALEFIGRGDEMRMAPAGDIRLAESPCIKCGQCSAHCPVGAIYEYDETQRVWAALSDKEAYPVVQIAPAVRVAIGEAFGYEPGALLTGKLYAALRRLGFKAVFDTNFGADLTIIEEGHEFAKRFASGHQLPLLTSCCPAWVDWMEKYAHDFLDNFSTCKSPHQMVGALAKTYYAQKAGIAPRKIVMVSVMPCTAKKYEIARCQSMASSGMPDIDISITTRELARMVKAAGLDFRNLPDESPDSLLAEYSGAGTIFGVTGGVMEAAVRTAHYLITGKEMPDVNFYPVRGLEGVKEAALDLGGQSIRIAVAHQMGHVEAVLNAIREDRARGREPRYQFIEVMACRGGCIGGGGQPYGATDEIRAKRARGLYADDAGCRVRCSHQNPLIQKIYAEFLGSPNSETSHRYLHTHYTKRPVYAR
jgi:iron-only hydrogenase group A